MDLLVENHFGVGKKILRKINLTRLTDITSLDVLGIPVWTSFRSHVDLPEDNISVYNGKGFTRKSARLGAIMEAVERFSAEKPNSNLKTLVASVDDQVRNERNHLSPKDTPLCQETTYRNSQPLEWVRGKNLLNGKETWLPATAVFCPYTAPENTKSFGYWSSTGLASSFSKTTALIRALLELIERDHAAMSRFLEKETCVDLDRIASKPVKWLLEKFRKAGVNLVVKDITCNLDIPTFMASCDDPHTHNVNLLNSGFAAHWDPETALSKAILEAAQSRLTTLQGAREDLIRHTKRYGKRNYLRLRNDTLRYFFDASGPKSDLSRFNKPVFRSPRHALDGLLRLLDRNGFDRVLAADLTSDQTGIPVVRTIVPNLEIWDDYEYERKGPRLKKAVRNWLRRHEDS